MNVVAHVIATADPYTLMACGYILGTMVSTVIVWFVFLPPSPRRRPSPDVRRGEAFSPAECGKGCGCSWACAKVTKP